MNPQLTHTLATFTEMTAYALVVGGASYFLCLLLRKIDAMWAWDILVAIACIVLFLLLKKVIWVFLILFVVAGLCALLKTPINKSWKSNFRFLLTSGSSSLIFGAMLLHLIWSLAPNKFQMFLLTNRDVLFLLLVLAPCAISAMHSVLTNSKLRPGIDRHLTEGEFADR